MKDDWDFYPCRVDDAPASIHVNLALRQHLGSMPENTLYALRIEMHDAGKHGMGSATEAESMYPVEDELVRLFSGIPLRYVGRVRNLGTWQLTLMGAPGHSDEIERLAHRCLDGMRRFSLVTSSHSDWSYYTDFLCPNDERMRWIEDRRVVEVLEREGDPLTQARRVDHWVYLPDHAAQGAFASAITSQGFSVLEHPAERAEYCVQVYRVDFVRLEDIHRVTNLLTEIALRLNGKYDGWETSVERE